MGQLWQRVSGVWQNVTAPARYARVAGAWRQQRHLYQLVGARWYWITSWFPPSEQPTNLSITQVSGRVTIHCDWTHTNLYFPVRVEVYRDGTLDEAAEYGANLSPQVTRYTTIGDYNGQKVFFRIYYRNNIGNGPISESHPLTVVIDSGTMV